MLSRIKKVELGFKETYQGALNEIWLEVSASNFTYKKVAYTNIWNGDESYKFGGNDISSIKDLLDGSSSDGELKEQLLNVMLEVVDLLIQSNKKCLDELVGMVVIPLNKNGKPAGFGEKIESLKIPKQQKITINNKTYYEQNSVVNKMLGN